METVSTNKKTFKDKIKDRVSLLKQKSSDTLLHARSSYVREKLHDNIEFQHCVESFLPQLHHENEIKEALLENVVEMRVKESSQARQEQRKREYDFFTGVWKDNTNSSSKSKKKTKSPTADIVSSPLNEDDIEEHKITPSIKTTLKYFDTEINEKSLVTSTIISKMNWENDVNSLFWDGKEKPIENCLSRRNIKEEGFFVGSKPRARSQRLRGILSHADDQSEWFDAEGELMLEDNPVCELNNQIRYIPIKEVELLTIFTKPVLFSNKNVKQYVPLETQNEFGEYLIEFNFRTLNFNHHPLFSIEHIIAQKVVKAYDLYIKTQTQGTLKQHEDLLSSLRRTKAFNEQRILLENDNSQKRLYKNSDFRKNIKEIAKVRKSRFKEAFIQRKLENELLKLWRTMKHIRKQLKYTSTSLVLEVTKTETDIIEDRDAWEEQFELEVSDIIAKIKCDYFELRSDFSKKSKRLKRTSPDSESELSQKPQLEYDEVKIRKNLFNEMCETFRQPGEPIISFKLSRSSAIITKTPSVSSEVNRRLDVDKTKLFVQVSVNNRDVCKTKNIPLNHDFILKIQESGSIRLPKDTKSIKLLIFEHNSFLRPTSIGEVFITIPKNNVLISDAKTESYPFLLKNKRNYNHIGVGTCNTLAEIINKKHPQLVLQNMDLQEVIVCEGSVNMKIGWTTETGAEDISNQLQANPSAANFVLPKEIPNAEIMSQLFDTVLDPNDPKNSFLFTFMNNFKDKAIKNDKFYLNYFFNFDFLLTRTSDPYVDMKSVVDLDNERELVRGNHLEVMSNDGASTSTMSRPRGSVLDDTTLLKKILDPIDLQRRTSIRYLQLVNEHLSLQSDNGKKEKQLSDIVTIFKYPGIKTITINFLRPKRPLFYQTRQQPSTPKVQIVDTKRDYTLKICILKAFQLPCRSKTIQTGTSSNTDEDGGLKMISLKPFVRVTCQGRSLRTSTAVGNNPTWNEQLCFPVRFDTSSTISFHLFDETFEDLLADDRLENSTVHCQYSANWLGSMKILLSTVFSQTKIEGTFLMNSPPDLFGYKQNLEEKYAHSRVSYDSLRKEIHFKQREGFFMTMFLEIFPSYLDPPPPVEILETNEMDYMIKHIENFTETYKSAFPERKLDVLVLDTSGKYICITRLFKPLPLPEFGDNLSTMFANASAYEESVSSKNSTPNKKKSSKNQSGDDAATRSTKSVISTIVGEVRRSSKTVKDTFEMKSLDENLMDSAERGLASKIQICTRFVAMIPLFELNSLSNHSVALSGYQTLRLVCGSMMDHTTLLMNYFLYLGIDCWFISGLALPRGLSTYVLVQENQQTKELRGKEGMKSYARLRGVKTKNIWKYCIYDATTGIKYDTKDPFCPLQRVYFVCNGENIWVNIQAVERCNLTKFDLSASSEWRPVFQRDSLLACPGPLPGLPSGYTALYSYTSQDTLSLRDAVEDKIRNKIQRWRGHRRTIWNRHCSSVLKSMLVHWEKWSLNQSSQKPRNSQKLQQLLLSYQMYGFPYNTTYTSMGEIVSAMKATQIHLDEHTSTEFALGVEVFPYPNNIYSVWIYLASVIRN